MWFSYIVDHHIHMYDLQAKAKFACNVYFICTKYVADMIQLLNWNIWRNIIIPIEF